MPASKRPTAYDAVCLVLAHLLKEGQTTVTGVLVAGVVSDEGTARNALEALTRHGLASKHPSAGRLAARYWAVKL